jgi:hypothetical protein
MRRLIHFDDGSAVSVVGGRILVGCKLISESVQRT